MIPYFLPKGKISPKGKKLLNTDFSKTSIDEMAKDLKKRIELLQKIKHTKEILLLNIGTNYTEYANYDTFGPRIGTYLETFMKNQKISCYGTMIKPIHALNLKDFLSKNKIELKQKVILVTDAAIGEIYDYLSISISNGKTYPGTATNKKLPSMGDISILGTTTIGESNLNIANFEIEELSETTAQIIKKALTNII